MNVHLSRARKPHGKSHASKGRPPFDCIALLLQGGGALGAYQGGVYQGLAEAGLHPDWVAGISIGAINSALIAGNPPQERVEKLRGFWAAITVNPIWALAACGRSAADALGLLGLGAASLAPQGDLARNWANRWGLGAASLAPQGDLARNWANRWGMGAASLAPQGDFARGWANRLNAYVAAAMGAPGMFAPRLVSPWLQAAGTVAATSYYDTSILKTTLERFVDFDRINAGETRFSVGAVNVTTGNFVYFDNTTHTITPEHVMASGALPPGFPAVEIEGEYYWDGGLVSNTPLQWVLESDVRQDTLAFQVDLWSARGDFPRTIAEVGIRQKEIQYSSRTRANSDQFKRSQKIRNALSDLLAKLPDELRDTPEYKALRPEADRKIYNLIQLIYRSRDYEGESKDYEFSQQSRDDHWRAGYQDTIRTLRHPEVLEPTKSEEGVWTFDLAMHGRE